MRKWTALRTLSTLIATIFTVKAYAVAPGFYMGMVFGPATNGGGQQNAQVLPLPTASAPKANVSPANPSSSQFGTEFLLGYKFNQYAGFETGFVFFSGINYTLKNSAAVAAAGTTARVRIIDLMGKIDYTFRDTFGVFGKLGVAGVYMTTPGGLNVQNFHTVTKKNPKTSPPSTITETINVGSNTYSTKAVPAFALGVSYDLTQNWVMDLSANTFLVGGNLSNVTMYGLGLSYHFVDVYCGQFLC